MIKKIISVFILGQAFVANAGKLERGYLAESVDPAIQKAIADVKNTCKCPTNMKIAYDSKEVSSKSMDELSPLFYMAEKISEGVANSCVDDASRAAICKMKEIKLKYGKETQAKLVGTVGELITDGQSNALFSVLADELDK